MNNLKNIIFNKKWLVKLEKIFLLTNLLIFFFLWDIKYYLQEINIYFDPRILILFSLIFIIPRIKEGVKKVIISLLLSFLIAAHLFINLYYDQIYIEHKHFSYIVFFFIIIFFTLNYKDVIILNIKKICIIFLCISSSFLIIFNYNIVNYKELFFCGFIRSEGPLFKIFFQENSHFGMIASSILFYILTSKKNLYENILMLIFIVNFFFYSSTTLVFSLTLMLILLVFLEFYYKKNYIFNNKKIFFLLLIFIMISLSKYSCNRKIFEFTKLDFINSRYLENNKGIIDKYFKDVTLSDAEKKKLLINEYNNSEVTITTQVFINSLEIALNTLSKRFLGYGINNYETAFNKEISLRENFYYIEDVKHINKNDGSSNALKLMTEFGILSFFIPIYVVYFFFKKNIPINIKLFLISIILSQSLRGAGYFNGGFLISLILIISLSHSSQDYKS